MCNWPKRDGYFKHLSLEVGLAANLSESKIVSVGSIASTVFFFCHLFLGHPNQS